MSICDTCEHAGNCKSETALRQLERVGGVEGCSGFKQREDNTSLYADIREGLRQALAYEKNTWVEVVRCKDCKYHEDLRDGGVKCQRIDGLLMIFPDDYCSYGRRKMD